MICAKYSDDWKEERPYPEKSSFTIKGYDLEAKKWLYPEMDENDTGKLLYTLYMVEHSPDHPSVMGRCFVYEKYYYPQVNPYFNDEEMIKIQQEFKKYKLNN